MPGLAGYLEAFLGFINDILIPFLFGLALLFFVVNIFRFFVLGSNEQEARENARRLALYGILAFVFLVSIWGIVNMVVAGLGIDDDKALESDYIEAMRPDPAGLSRNPFDTGRNNTTVDRNPFDTNRAGVRVSPDITTSQNPFDTGRNDTTASRNPFDTNRNDNTVSRNPFDTGQNDTTVTQNPFDTERTELTTNGDYSLIANSALDTIFDSYNMQTPLYDLMTTVTQSTLDDVRRIQIAKAMHSADVISSNDLNSLTSAINTVRDLNGAGPINIDTVAPDQDMSDQLKTYNDNLNEVDTFFSDWYGSSSYKYEITKIELFDTEEFPLLADRQKNAEDLFDSLVSQQPNAKANIDKIKELVEDNYEIEEQGWF